MESHNTQARDGTCEGDLDECLEEFCAERGCNKRDFNLARDNLKEWMYDHPTLRWRADEGGIREDQAPAESVRASGGSSKRKRSRSPVPARPARLTPRPPDSPPPLPPPPTPPPQEEEPEQQQRPLEQQRRPFRRAFGGQGVEGQGWCWSCSKWRNECFQRYDWECERCQNHNYANKQVCSRCGLGRSAFQIYPDGFGSDGKKVDIGRVCASHQCPMLECFKPFDWMCSCGGHNFASKTVLGG